MNDRPDLSALIETYEANTDAAGDWTAVDCLPDDAYGAAGADQDPNSPDTLSRLDEGEYNLRRKAAAKLLCMGVGDLDRYRRDARRKRRQRAQEAQRVAGCPEPGKTTWPPGFRMADSGLFAEASDNGAEMWLCGPFKVLGAARDSAGEGWATYLTWTDPDRRPHTWAMPQRLLMVSPGELEGILVDRGLSVSTNPTARLRLREALAGVRSGGRVLLVSHPGWHAPAGATPAFVLPNAETIGRSPETLVLKAPADLAHQAMTPAGAFEGWQRGVAAKLVGNPIPAFVMAAAFAGPLLKMVSETSGGFHFHGRSKVGKTLLLRLGLSVWGEPTKAGLLLDWRSTANALEAAAEQRCDGLLPLDEVHQADPREVVGAVYSLVNEAGKSRLSRDAAARPKRTWQAIVLSTGEIDLAAMAAKANQKMPAGAEVRIPSIPVDTATMWPNLHGATGPTEFMAELQASVSNHHGLAARPFLEWLSWARRNHADRLDQEAADTRRHFESLLPIGSDPQVRDVARRCALVALAGELAVRCRVLPWTKGEATEAAEAVLRLWLDRRGGAGSTEEHQHVTAIRAYLSEFGPSRFMPLHMNDGGKWVESVSDKLGTIRSGFRRIEHGDAAETFLILPDAWRDICTKAGVDPTEAARTLARADLLETEQDGKHKTKSLNLPKIGKARVYLVKPDIFDTVAEQEGGLT